MIAKPFRGMLLFLLLTCTTLSIAGCGHHGGDDLAGNTYQAADGTMSISFDNENHATIKRNGQGMDYLDYTVKGDAVTVKTKIIGDMVFTRQPDGNLKLGPVTLTLVKK
jgi:hypothetical protein